MIHSLRTLLAATLLVAGATVSLAGPAEASEPGCAYVYGHYEEAERYITAYAYYVCLDYEVAKPVRISQFQSRGIYETVASGVGTVTYYCNGGAYNVYHTTGTADFAIRCG